MRGVQRPIESSLSVHVLPVLSLDGDPFRPYGVIFHVFALCGVKVTETHQLHHHVSIYFFLSCAIDIGLSVVLVISIGSQVYQVTVLVGWTSLLMLGFLLAHKDDIVVTRRAGSRSPWFVVFLWPTISRVRSRWPSPVPRPRSWSVVAPLFSVMIFIPFSVPISCSVPIPVSVSI